MYEYNKVINGLAKYIDTEIVDKITGWKKWVVGTGFSIALSKGTNLFNSLKKNELIKTMEIVDSNDRINVEELYQHLLKEADKGAITFDVPMLGAMTLSRDDVDKLYRLIKEG